MSWVEFDLPLDPRSRAVVGGFLLLFGLLGFLNLLFVGRRDDAPAPFPGCAGAEPDAHPVFVIEPRPFQDGFNVVQRLALSSNQGASIRFLEQGVLVLRQTDGGGPLRERVQRVEMQQISVFASGGEAEDVLEGLVVRESRWKGLDLLQSVSTLSSYLYRSARMQVNETYHFDGSISDVDVGWMHVSRRSGFVQGGGVPHPQHGADQLGEALGPLSFCVGSTL